MASSARQAASCRRLLELVRSGATGRLTVGAGSDEIALFLLDGHLIASRTPDDTGVLIERLEAAGHLSTSRARQLQAMQTMSSTVLGQGVADPILGLVFDEVGDAGLDEHLALRFEETVAHFVGHRDQPQFHAGEAPWAYIVRMGHDSGALVEQAAEAWDLAADVDDDRVLMPGPVAPDGPASEALVRAFDGGPAAVGEVIARLGLPPVLGRARIARALHEALLVDIDEVPAADGARRPLPPLPPEVEEVVDALEDELDAFSGAADAYRGGPRGGTFVTERENLDRVELVDVDTSPATPAYSAPALTEEDARAKIQVANEVLLVVAAAYERARGPNEGAQVVQLLVDGRPRSYVALFDAVRVRPSGDLPPAEIIANVRRRPETEQRHLLNQGMLDLLDRALDKAADELPEDQFEDVLAQVMGYRQRLVL